MELERLKVKPLWPDIIREKDINKSCGGFVVSTRPLNQPNKTGIIVCSCKLEPVPGQRGIFYIREPIRDDGKPYRAAGNHLVNVV